MNNQKVFFPTNIKFLRERKKLSQEAMAEILGIGRSKYNALENGQTKAPQPEDLIHFSNTFKISIDSLLKIDLSKISELKLRELEAGSDIYLQGGNIRVLAISVDKNNKENMEYVPVKAKAGYRTGFNDPEFIAALPKFSMPNLPKSGTFRMFPTTGDSMLPIPEGCDVICKFVADWLQVKPRTLCIVVLKGEQDFVFKLVTIGSEGTVLLESLNKLYAPYTVTVSEVLEIWQFHSYQTQEVPDTQTDLMEIKRMISSLQDQVLKKL
ncbi:XRE family transcriptional regulator [Pedobacter steynii]|uniref:DNA-binding protein n=1 Tax=Pedobacter steynii TaxID=430522 RepID=A0A1D7QMW8_9SPHI|nr:helix-turn-helix domain-containing protein [Pedobacter steynii]AOM80006.1 DNA-binding protein [Pedobacter steynii]